MALKLPQSRQLGPNRTFGHRFVHLRQIRRRKQVVRDAIQSGELSTHLGASRFVVERVVVMWAIHEGKAAGQRAWRQRVKAGSNREFTAILSYISYGS